MTDLDHYQGLIPSETIMIKAELSRLEAAAVLKAYDSGLLSLSGGEREQIDRVIAKLKDGIWP
ncbi:hypothetical protein D3C87_616310 [compost metagenome]